MDAVVAVDTKAVVVVGKKAVVVAVVEIAVVFESIVGLAVVAWPLIP